MSRVTILMRCVACVNRIPHLRLAVLAAGLGAAAGGAAWVLVHLIGLLTNLVLFHRWGWDAAELHRAPAAARGSSSPPSPAPPSSRCWPGGRR